MSRYSGFNVTIVLPDFFVWLPSGRSSPFNFKPVSFANSPFEVIVYSLLLPFIYFVSLVSNILYKPVSSS
ncbi:MAG: hypothetical protein IKN09_04095, partial [Clostridia bacterium]|nr:hypothetical protein [Clostridia bacterium]